MKRKGVKMYARGAPVSRARSAVDRSLAAQQARIAAIRARPGFRAGNPPAFFAQRGREVKAIDIASAAYPFRVPATATSIMLVNGVQTGAAFYNRVGSRIEMKNLHIRGLVRYAATSVVGTARMLVVYDRQPVGALPTVADILQTRDQTGAATNTGSSEINLDNRDRFQIVRDMEFYTPPCTNTAGVLTNGPQFPGQDDQQWDVNEFIKLKELTCHYKSTSNPCTIADIATGALYVLFTTTGTDSAVEFAGSMRLRYNDL